MFSDIALWQWLIMVICAILIGINKTGIPGIGPLPVVLLVVAQLTAEQIPVLPQTAVVIAEEPKDTFLVLLRIIFHTSHDRLKTRVAQPDGIGVVVVRIHRLHPFVW